MRNMLNKCTFQPKTADLVLMCLKLHLTIMNLLIITKNHHPHLRSTCPPHKGMPLRKPLPRRSQWWRKRRRLVSGILCIWHLAVGTYCGIVIVCGGPRFLAFVDNPCPQIFIPTNKGICLICINIILNLLPMKFTSQWTRKFWLPTNIDPPMNKIDSTVYVWLSLHHNEYNFNFDPWEVLIFLNKHSGCSDSLLWNNHWTIINLYASRPMVAWLSALLVPMINFDLFYLSSIQLTVLIVHCMDEYKFWK